MESFLEYLVQNNIRVADAGWLPLLWMGWRSAQSVGKYAERFLAAFERLAVGVEKLSEEAEATRTAPQAVVIQPATRAACEPPAAATSAPTYSLGK